MRGCPNGQPQYIGEKMTFNGFNENTNEFLIGIKYNNNKTWFQEHKELYTKNVHEPTLALATELALRMNEMDSSFTEVPKVSRANRDIRFSNNKAPYKEHKWFFLKDSYTRGSMPWNAPGYFFEISAEWWRYGLFYGDEPKVMAGLRAKIAADPAACERRVKLGDKSRFELEEENYKRIFNKELSPIANRWAQKKCIVYVKYEDYDNMDFYSHKLADTIFEGYKEIYDIYKYLKK